MAEMTNAQVALITAQKVVAGNEEYPSTTEKVLEVAAELNAWLRRAY